MDAVPLAAHRGTLLLRRRLLSQGFSDAEIAANIRRGTIERLIRGAFTQPPSGDETFTSELNRYIRRAIAHGLAAPGCTISHLSAAALHGLPVARSPLDTVHLIRPGPTGGERRPHVWFHSGKLDATEIVTRHDVKITSLARTVVDVARIESRRNAVAMADAALHAEMVTTDALTHAMTQAARSRGMPRARRALAQVDGRSESVGESYGRLAFAAAGVPPPELQVSVYSVDGAFLGRSDFGYISAGVLVEFDGEVKYRRMRRPGESIEDAVLREKSREDALREAGFIVVRLVWRDLFDLPTLRQRIRAAMVQGKRAMGAGLVTGRCVPEAPVRLD